ncbi:MAG: hypothetical protein ACRCUS_10670 [Anaerovoracaceae bacterium]
MSKLGRDQSEAVFYGELITALIGLRNSCNIMLADYKTKKDVIANDENTIRNLLFDNYLENDEIMEKVGLKDYRFGTEVEKYYKGKAIGRTDLQVYSKNCFNRRKHYFTIECKRIDGTKDLYAKYVTKGVMRFIADNDNTGKPKYGGEIPFSALFSFIVKPCIFEQKVVEGYIDSVEKKENIKPCMGLCKNSQKDFFESEHISCDKRKIVLLHTSYDFSQIIK